MDIKGIKMNGEILKEFSAGGGYTYIVEIKTVNDETAVIKTAKAYLTVYSKKDVSVNTTITSSQVETALGVLPYEYLQAVGSVFLIGGGVNSRAVCAGYFSSDGEFLCRTVSSGAKWESCGSSYTLTVVGKR